VSLLVVSCLSHRQTATDSDLQVCRRVAAIETRLLCDSHATQHLTLLHSLLPYGYRAERQSARMSKITNEGLTRSGTWCFIAVPIWQQWVSKGYWFFGVSDGRVSLTSSRQTCSVACELQNK